MKVFSKHLIFYHKKNLAPPNKLGHKVIHDKEFFTPYLLKKSLYDKCFCRSFT